jgi:hypothetical protein
VFLINLQEHFLILPQYFKLSKVDVFDKSTEALSNFAIVFSDEPTASTSGVPTFLSSRPLGAARVSSRLQFQHKSHKLSDSLHLDRRTSQLLIHNCRKMLEHTLLGTLVTGKLMSIWRLISR